MNFSFLLIGGPKDGAWYATDIDALEIVFQRNRETGEWKQATHNPRPSFDVERYTLRTLDPGNGQEFRFMALEQLDDYQVFEKLLGGYVADKGPRRT